mgnify:CR=1 FL=1
MFEIDLFMLKNKILEMLNITAVAQKDESVRLSGLISSHRLMDSCDLSLYFIGLLFHVSVISHLCLLCF